MDNQVLGALIGLLLAAANYFIFGKLMERKEASVGNSRAAEVRRSLSILDLVRKADIVLMPAIMYFLFGFIEEPILG